MVFDALLAFPALIGVVVAVERFSFKEMRPVKRDLPSADLPADYVKDAVAFKAANLWLEERYPEDKRAALKKPVGAVGARRFGRTFGRSTARVASTHDQQQMNFSSRDDSWLDSSDTPIELNNTMQISINLISTNT